LRQTFLMNQTPLVSVIVPCFNQAHFLRQAVDSAIAQSYPNVEVVVIDDGSTDGTWDVARSYGDRVKLVQQQNSGLPAARNAGIAAASGEFIVLLDSDDVLLPECIESRMRVMQSDPEIGIVAGYYREIDEQGNLIDRVPEVRRISSLPHFYQTVKRNWGPPVSWTIRRRALELCGPFDPFLRSCEDWDLLIRISRKFKIGYDPSVGAHYRQLPNSMSRNHIVMYDAMATLMRKNSAYAWSKVGFWFWSQFGRFQHGRRIIYNILTTGPAMFRMKWLLRICVARPAMIWIGFLSVISFFTGKRPSAQPASPAAEGETA
jgi:glycosyltransferase involved in cell wall biosynthesis